MKREFIIIRPGRPVEVADAMNIINRAFNEKGFDPPANWTTYPEADRLELALKWLAHYLPEMTIVEKSQTVEG